MPDEDFATGFLDLKYSCLPQDEERSVARDDLAFQSSLRWIALEETRGLHGM
jgi:hypothetical protein